MFNQCVSGLNDRAFRQILPWNQHHESCFITKMDNRGEKTQGLTLRRTRILLSISFDVYLHLIEDSNGFADVVEIRDFDVICLVLREILLALLGPPNHRQNVANDVGLAPRSFLL
jgi:hypothetical protein